MLHGLSNNFLYTAFKIIVLFTDFSGKEKTFEGTAFFIQYNGKIHLITNRHNVDIVYAEPKYRDFSINKINLIGRFSGDNIVELLVSIEQNSIFYSDTYANDIAIISDPQIAVISGEFEDLDYVIDQSMIAVEDDFKNDISVCDFVAFPGYPEWHDKSNQRPIFRSGTIASDPRFNYSYEKVEGDCVAYEAFSYGGSSGSPIFALQKGIKPGNGVSFPAYRPAKFIGINAGHLKDVSDIFDVSTHKHSGISYFFKSSAIIRAIDDAQAKALSDQATP